MTYGEKKLLYGTANRIAVGGRADEPVADHQKGAMLLIKKICSRSYQPIHPSQTSSHHEGIRRKDTDVEPVAYHSLPSEAVFWQHVWQHVGKGDVGLHGTD